MRGASSSEDVAPSGNLTGATFPDGLTSVSALLWTGETTRYAALPSAQRPAFLVPLGPRRVTTAALRGLPRLSSLPTTVRGAVAAIAGQSGALRLWPHQVTVEDPGASGSLLQHLSTSLRLPLTASARFGPPRANRKPVLELLDRRGRTIAFAKVGWNELTARLVRQEAEALRMLEARHLHHLVSPRVLANGTWDGLEYLLLSPVDTVASGDPGVRTRRAAMLELARTFEGRAVALSESPYWSRLLSSLQSLRGAGGARLWGFAERVDAAADRIRIIPSAWHGDWTPWNMTTQGDTAVVWDWERFECDVPIGFDALHFTFHHAVRRDGLTPSEAIRQLAVRAPELLEPFGVATAEAPAVVVLYLLHLGHRHVRDGQEEAGAKKGPLVTWLLSELDELVSSLVDLPGPPSSRTAPFVDPGQP